LCSEKKIIEYNSETYSKISGIWNETLNENYRFDLHKDCRDNFIKRITGRRILEVGCGLGYDALEFYENGYEVFATDIQFKMIQNIKEKNSNIQATVMNMCYPSFKPDTFDGIFSFASFLHIPRTLSKTTLSAFYRILKKDGILFLYHVQSSAGYESYLVENVLGQNLNLYCFCHTMEEMKNLFEKTGFVDAQISGMKNKKTKTGEKYSLETYCISGKKPGI
jgi:ubiquinone/menaquinone biosynthesis C-methylase UbiE